MKRLTLMALIAVLSLAVAAPAVATASPSSSSAETAAKKKGKKKKKKKKKKAKPAPVTPTPAPPTPTPLSAAEVINQVGQKAAAYCLPDPICVDSGYYGTDTQPECQSKAAYVWVCYGWNDEDDEGDLFTCDFREVVERVGLNGITSHQDLAYGDEGWDCFDTPDDAR
jgi:hypothetical protein